MDAAAIDRFSGPPLAERAWVSDQARACVVRPGNEDLQTLVQRDVRGKGELVWDSWRRPDGRWTVVAAIGEDSPVSTWLYDPRSRSIQPDDAASHRLASEDVVVPLRPSHSTLSLPREEPSAPAREEITPAETASAEFHAAGADAHDTASGSATGTASEPEGTEAPTEAPRSKSRKGRRASVPRWDEILFGSGQSDA
jgi:hypothetical protein